MIDFIRATLGSRATIELKLGDRVRLSELGVFRSSKIRVRTGVVVALSSRRSCGASLGILFDGNKRPTTLHRSYVELDEGGQGLNEALALASKTQLRRQGRRCSWWEPSHSLFHFWSRSISAGDRMMTAHLKPTNLSHVRVAPNHTAPLRRFIRKPSCGADNCL